MSVMDLVEREETLNALVKLKKEVDLYNSHPYWYFIRRLFVEESLELRLGICANIRMHYDFKKVRYNYIHIHTIWKQWKYYSGSANYPVPACGEYKKSYGDCDRIQYSATSNQWDFETEYGRLRYDLLNYLIEELKRETTN